MAQLVRPPASDPGTIFFELERLDVGDDGRLAVRGRWFGVRGRRFMRPTLTLRSAAARIRLLADLEHKPWPAEEAESWVAVFPWDLDAQSVSDLELSVAPDIAVGLPVPGADVPGAPIPSGRDTFVLARSEPTDADALSRKLTEEQHRNQLLREQLDQLRDAHVQAVAATARRDAALAALEVAQRERGQAADELERARGEFREAVASARAEREEAIQACQLARRETAEARSERGAAIRASERLGSERAVALRSAEQAGAARDDALRTAEEARTETARVRLERDEATAALELARRERDEAVGAAGLAARERDKATRARDKALRERDKAVHGAEQASAEAARAPGLALQPARTFTPRRTYSTASGKVWASRGLALIVLVAILVAVALILKVV